MITRNSIGGGGPYKEGTYRKAAREVDELDEDITTIYIEMKH